MAAGAPAFDSNAMMYQMMNAAKFGSDGGGGGGGAGAGIEITDPGKFIGKAIDSFIGKSGSMLLGVNFSSPDQIGSSLALSAAAPLAAEKNVTHGRILGILSDSQGGFLARILFAVFNQGGREPMAIVQNEPIASGDSSSTGGGGGDFSGGGAAMMSDSGGGGPMMANLPPMEMPMVSGQPMISNVSMADMGTFVPDATPLMVRGQGISTPDMG